MKTLRAPRAKQLLRRCSAFAPGKIILAGEYAVLCGHPGIAIPAPIGVQVRYEEDPDAATHNISWHGILGSPEWKDYLSTIVHLCEKYRTSPARGRLAIQNDLPLGKGMGSSTALIIAIARCLLGDDCRTQAVAMENVVNPGGSGIDFNVIWDAKSLRFVKGQPPQAIDLPNDLLANAILIDTGAPNEATPELVAWVRSRSGDLRISAAVKTIAACTLRLEAGEDLAAILRDHHRAQVALGVVPAKVQELIAAIEAAGGAAKVLGAGARTGGGGMVLALHHNPDILRSITKKHRMLPLTSTPTP